MAISRRSTRNGTVNLAHAMAQMVEMEATLLKLSSELKIEMLALKAEDGRIQAEWKAAIDEVKSILLRHERILNELPETIKQRIGFQSPRIDQGN